MLFFMPFSHPERVFVLEPLQAALLFISGLITVTAFGSFSEAIDHLEISRISTVLACIPLITIGSMKIISGLIPGFIESEPLNLLSIAGALLVVSGSMQSSLSRTP